MEVFEVETLRQNNGKTDTLRLFVIGKFSVWVGE